MSARETLRLAWRSRVEAAAQERQRHMVPVARGRIYRIYYIGPTDGPHREISAELRAALAAPKPWLGERGQRWQPVRHPRRKRTPSPFGVCWCRRCIYAKEAPALRDLDGRAGA
jgi:hypothetical protein